MIIIEEMSLQRFSARQSVTVPTWCGVLRQSVPQSGSSDR